MGVVKIGFCLVVVIWRQKFLTVGLIFLGGGVLCGGSTLFVGRVFICGAGWRVSVKVLTHYWDGKKKGRAVRIHCGPPQRDVHEEAH